MLPRFLRSVGHALLRLPRPVAWLLAFAWYGLIWTWSSQPGVILVGPWYLAVLSNLAHAPLFGLLGLWLCLLIARRDGWPDLTRARVLALLAAVLALGVVDELHQHFTPNRDMSAADLLTDVTGAYAVLLVVRHLAAREHTSAGVAARLAVGVLACAIAAFVATYTARIFPSATWL